MAPRLLRSLASLGAVALAVTLLFAKASSAETLIFLDEDGGNGNPGGLFNFDTDSLEFSLRVALSNPDRITAIDFSRSDGRVFGVNEWGTLFVLDIDTGTRNFIGDTGLGRLYGVALEPTTNQVFGLTDSGNLYSISATTAEPVLIGPTDISPEVACPRFPRVTRGLSFLSDGRLFGTDRQTGLYELDRQNASPTFIGRSACAIGGQDSTITMSGDFFEGSLHGWMIKIDLATGERTFVEISRMRRGIFAFTVEPFVTRELPSPLGRKFAGVYFGSFEQGQNPGEFAVLVRRDGTAVFSVYSNIDVQGFVNEGIPIRSDGSFEISEFEGEGISMNGTFTTSGVSGQVVTTDGTVVDFSGTKAPTEGFLKEAAGYYTGPLNGRISATDGFNTVSGPVIGSNYSIVAANGMGFTFLDALFVINAGAGQRIQFVAEDGGSITIQPDGQIEVPLSDGLEFSGSFDLSQKTAEGTFFESETIEGITLTTSGSWSATQRLPLPKPVASLPWLQLLVDE